MVLMFDGIHSLMFLPLNLKMMFPSSPEQVYFGVKGRGVIKGGSRFIKVTVSLVTTISHKIGNIRANKSRHKQNGKAWTKPLAY